MDYKKLVEEFIGKEGEGRNHERFAQPCPLCKELRDFAEFLDKLQNENQGTEDTR